MVWLVVESVRELAGPGKILGNHVVIEIEDGIFAVLAHLRQGSLSVAKGDVVTVGTQIGSCGNSGNSTEPHVHFQLMDRPNVLIAAGLPMKFSWTESNGQLRSGMPATGEYLATPPNSPASRDRDR
jgi:murein DD-endopeptidase MepM/ murein hydrolase activator NlpD